MTRTTIVVTNVPSPDVNQQYGLLGLAASPNGQGWIDPATAATAAVVEAGITRAAIQLKRNAIQQNATRYVQSVKAAQQQQEQELQQRFGCILSDIALRPVAKIKANVESSCMLPEEAEAESAQNDLTALEESEEASQEAIEAAEQAVETAEAAAEAAEEVVDGIVEGLEITETILEVVSL